MMHLEDDLKRALRAESPAPGFANRVMKRVEREDQHQARPGWWRAAAASLTLAALLGGYAVHRQREGERARDELLRAMSITSEKVRYAQQEVRSIGSPD
jgi:hypothetical protein